MAGVTRAVGPKVVAAGRFAESSHGSANGAVLNVDGSVAPPIFGLPLDGKGGRQEIRDTDQGALDGDTQFDRAIGPLQFIPQTWSVVAAPGGSSRRCFHGAFASTQPASTPQIGTAHV